MPPKQPLLCEIHGAAEVRTAAARIVQLVQIEQFALYETDLRIDTVFS